MKFCKKCHKVIIKEIFTTKDLGNRCRCDDEKVFIVKGSEMEGIFKKELTKIKRCGIKRSLIKSMVLG